MTKEGIIVENFHLLNRWTNSELIEWEYWRSRVASRVPTHVGMGTKTRWPGQWVPNDACAIDRLRVQSWINVITKDWGDQINTTMNGGGCLVLIWDQTCRALLGYKGKHLSGDKGTRTDEHGPKIRPGLFWWNWLTLFVSTLKCSFVLDV